MTIAVVSDIHDNIWNLEKALRRIESEVVGRLLFLGDFCAPFTLAQLAEGFFGPIDIVFGNNDGDTFLLTRIASQFDHVTIHGHLGEIVVQNRKIALHHYPDIAKPLAESGSWDAVFSGHDHRKYQYRFGSTLWANPGEVMGRFGEPGFGVYDTQAHSFAHISID